MSRNCRSLPIPRHDHHFPQIKLRHNAGFKQSLKISAIDGFKKMISLLGRIISQYYVDAAYCYRRSSVVGRSVCHSCEPCKTAEAIKIPFGLWTRVGSKKHILDEDAHCRHLANTIEPFMFGGDAALCQITSTTCFFLYWVNCVKLLRPTRLD